MLSASVEKYGSPTFIYPLDGYVAVPFGERENYLTKAVEFHCGVDIATREKAEVLAALGGCVIETGNKDTYGLYLKIDHGNGWQTVYGHCSEILVKAGDKVEQGDIVAGVKFAGTAESHLHFEIWKDEMPVDPLLYLNRSPFEPGFVLIRCRSIYVGISVLFPLTLAISFLTGSAGYTCVQCWPYACMRRDMWPSPSGLAKLFRNKGPSLRFKCRDAWRKPAVG